MTIFDGFSYFRFRLTECVFFIFLFSFSAQKTLTVGRKLSLIVGRSSSEIRASAVVAVAT